MNPADLFIDEVGVLLRERQLSAIELLTAHLERIAAQNGALGAFVHLDTEGALARAQAADDDFAVGVDRGALQGIPVAVKDLIDTADMPTQYGSGLFAGHRPEADAACVKALKAAGANVIGKLATYEFATVGPSFDTPFAPPKNPWDPDRITGGSSSGSASAVAGGLVRLALGTDTGGSVRSPASYCGIVGFKPGYDLLSREGVFPLSPSLDHVGVVAASVREAAIGYGAMADARTGAAQAGLDGLTVGYARDWFADDPEVEAGVVEVLDDAVSTLSLLGARVREVSLPDYDLFEAACAAILHAEAFAIHRERLAHRADGMSVKTLRTLGAGAALSGEDIALARRAGRMLGVQMDAVLARVDLIVCATTLTTAPEVRRFAGAEAVWTPMRTIGFNLTGHPALSLPCGFSGGMPVGMQIIGRRGCEAMVLRAGAAFEAGTDFAAQRPALLGARKD